MKKFVAEIAGGLIVVLVASAVGLAHNAVRENSLPLIQRVNPTVVSDGPADETYAAGPGNAVVEEVLREGTVTADQLKELIDGRLAVVIDARSPGEYEEAHVVGALNVPHDRIPDYLDYLLQQVPMDALVVCYCQGPDCDFSDLLATELKIIGYFKVVLFPGGWEHWKAAGYPTESTRTDN